MQESLWSKKLIILIVSNFMLFLGFEMMVVCLPVYMEQIGGSDTIVGVSVGLFTFAALFVRAAAGWLLDRFGRRPVYLVGLAFMILISLTFGFLYSVALVVAVRLLHAVGWGLSSTSTNTIAVDTIPRQRFAEGMGYFALSNSLGMAAGPALGLAIIGRTSFRSMCVVAAVTAFIALVLSFFLHLRPGRASSQAADAPSEPASSEGAAQRPSPGDREEPADGFGAVLRSMLNRDALHPSLVMLLCSTTYGALTGFVALFGAERQMGNSGIYFAVYALTLLLTRPSAGKAADRRGPAFVVWPGILLTFCGMWCLSLAHSLPLFLCSAVLYGAGMGILMSCLEALAVASVEPDRRGSATATYLIGFDAGIGAGSVVAGFAASALGYGGMYRLLSLFLVAAAILFFVGSRRRRNHV